MKLSELKAGERARITALKSDGAMRKRLRDMGVTEGTGVSNIMRSPLGDPAAYMIRGSVIALRDADAALIETERYDG